MEAEIINCSLILQFTAQEIQILFFNFQTMDEKKEFVGQEIKGYKIIKPIGQGKFSTVYQAVNAEGVLVAVKKIKIFDMMDPKQREKCLKEVDLMKPLSHPNIIKYIDSFTHNNELIIVTEWAEKGDLKRLIKEHQQDQNPFDEVKIWEYLIQISSALKHMHQKQIMHRDLKPANIFIAFDDTLKIGDLGLGRIFGSETIEAHSKVGTPLYMSPELLRDEGYRMNADVWSLGCICYEFAQLHSPFRNENQKMSLMELFNNITRGQFKPISNRYSPELSSMIKKMIVADPNQRLSSAQVFEISTQNLINLKKIPKLDCFITMEDIVNKLNLLDYRQFCKVTNHKPVHRAYFAVKQESKEPNDQLFYFLELCYWLMNLAKVDKTKQKAALLAKSMIDWKSTEQACTKFLNDLLAFGVKHELTNKHIFQGYGQNVCYIINQLINKELIRINYKFKAPDQAILNQKEPEQFDELEVEEDKEIHHNNHVEEQDIEETLEFERSMLFKRGKKIDSENNKLLEKIKEIDVEDINMITPKVDEVEWDKECARVDKHLVNIQQTLKQSKFRGGFENFERTKQCSSKISDLIKFVKPFSYNIYSRLDRDLEVITRGERYINNNFKQLTAAYAFQNKDKTKLVDRLNKLTATVNDQVKQLQEIEIKSEHMNQQIQSMNSQTTEQPLINLRQTIKNMKKDIKEMDTKIGLTQWQLRHRPRNQDDTLEFQTEDF